jgi:hypothetical protein
MKLFLSGICGEVRIICYATTIFLVVAIVLIITMKTSSLLEEGDDETSFTTLRTSPQSFLSVTVNTTTTTFSPAATFATTTLMPTTSSPFTLIPTLSQGQTQSPSRQPLYHRTIEMQRKVIFLIMASPDYANKLVAQTWGQYVPDYAIHHIGRCPICDWGAHLPEAGDHLDPVKTYRALLQAFDRFPWVEFIVKLDADSYIIPENLYAWLAKQQVNGFTEDLWAGHYLQIPDSLALGSALRQDYFDTQGAPAAYADGAGWLVSRHTAMQLIPVIEKLEDSNSNMAKSINARPIGRMWACHPDKGMYWEDVYMGACLFTNAGFVNGPMYHPHNFQSTFHKTVEVRAKYPIITHYIKAQQDYYRAHFLLRSSPVSARSVPDGPLSWSVYVGSEEIGTAKYLDFIAMGKDPPWVAILKQTVFVIMVENKDDKSHIWLNSSSGVQAKAVVRVNDKSKQPYHHVIPTSSEIYYWIFVEPSIHIVQEHLGGRMDTIFSSPVSPRSNSTSIHVAVICPLQASTGGPIVSFSLEAATIVSSCIYEHGLRSALLVNCLAARLQLRESDLLCTLDVDGLSQQLTVQALKGSTSRGFPRFPIAMHTFDDNKWSSYFAQVGILPATAMHDESVDYFSITV